MLDIAGPIKTNSLQLRKNDDSVRGRIPTFDYSMYWVDDVDESDAPPEVQIESHRTILSSSMSFEEFLSAIGVKEG